jgi:hypothetical protein
MIHNYAGSKVRAKMNFEYAIEVLSIRHTPPVETQMKF